MDADKRRKIGFWIATAILALGLLGGGVMDLLSGPDVVQQFKDLGYPEYLPRFLGAAKLLGAAAILAPGFTRLKEWAYAGVTFDMMGATYSHIANGDGPDKIMPPLVFLAIAAVSYLLRPSDRKLPDAPGG